MALSIPKGFVRAGLERLIAFALASTSIGSLLLYFLGYLSLRAGVLGLLLPSACILTLFVFLSKNENVKRRILLGLWAGSFATLFYDIVRVPLVHQGLPIFKAISYFGTVLLAVPRPTLGSEIAGWGFHLSNGIGFAIMYTLLVGTPRLWSAALWGVLLEAAMLATPYAEIFGYSRSPAFVVITLSSHIFFGVGLWLACKFPPAAPLLRARFSFPMILAGWLIGPLVIAGIAADFHKLHAETIPTSPPPELGPHLYVTWNTPEPDRIGAIWLMKRFVDPKARFHFIKPMSQPAYGIPFDIPEAALRRSQNLSVFQAVLNRVPEKNSRALQALASMCYGTEIRPWALGSSTEDLALASDLRGRIADCKELSACIDNGTQWFNDTYERLALLGD